MRRCSQLVQSVYSAIVSVIALVLIVLVIVGIKTHPYLVRSAEVMTITLLALFPVGLMVLIYAGKQVQRAFLGSLFLTGLWSLLITITLLRGSP